MALPSVRGQRRTACREFVVRWSSGSDGCANLEGGSVTALGSRHAGRCLWPRAGLGTKPNIADIPTHLQRQHSTITGSTTGGRSMREKQHSGTPRNESSLPAGSCSWELWFLYTQVSAAGFGVERHRVSQATPFGIHAPLFRGDTSHTLSWQAKVRPRSGAQGHRIPQGFTLKEGGQIPQKAVIEMQVLGAIPAWFKMSSCDPPLAEKPIH